MIILFELYNLPPCIKIHAVTFTAYQYEDTKLYS